MSTLLFLGPVNVTLLGRRVFADIVEDLEMKRPVGSLSGGTPNPMTSVLIRDTQTEEEMAKRRCRQVLSDAATI